MSHAESEQPTDLRDDRPECWKCNEYIIDWAVRVLKGYWTGSEFDGDPMEDYWCRECYREHRKREAAAHYEIDDHERLWAILEAADGELVADTYPLTVGGRGYVRVVDGEPQAMRIATRRKEDRVVTFEAEPIADYDREAFEGLFSVDGDGDEDPPRIVYLKPADETPFAKWSQLPEGQSTLIEEADSDE
jgi:hypothetical protein